MLRCDGSAPVTVTVPAGLQVGFGVGLFGYGSGAITVAGAEGVDALSAGLELSEQYAAGSVVIVTDDEFMTAGDF